MNTRILTILATLMTLAISQTATAEIRQVADSNGRPTYVVWGGDLQRVWNSGGIVYSRGAQPVNGRYLVTFYQGVQVLASGNNPTVGSWMTVTVDPRPHTGFEDMNGRLTSTGVIGQVAPTGTHTGNRAASSDGGNLMDGLEGTNW